MDVAGLAWECCCVFFFPQALHGPYACHCICLTGEQADTPDDSWRDVAGTSSLRDSAEEAER